ncbi:MAG: hypothetical protein ChlgKO_06510 [Chlamydiales bacterium]
MGIVERKQEQPEDLAKVAADWGMTLEEYNQSIGAEPVQQQVHQQAEQHFSLLAGQSADVKQLVSKLKQSNPSVDRVTLADVPSQLLVGDDGKVYSAAEVIPTISFPAMQVSVETVEEKTFSTSRIEAFGEMTFDVVEDVSDQNAQYATMLRNAETLNGFIQRALAENPNDADAREDQKTLNGISDMHAFGFGVRDYQSSPAQNEQIINLLNKYLDRFNKPVLTKFNAALKKVMTMNFRFDTNLNVLPQRGYLRAKAKGTTRLNNEAKAVKEKLVETALRLLPVNQNVAGFPLTPQEADVKTNTKAVIRIYNQQIANRLGVVNGKELQVSDRERQFMVS